MHLKSLLPAALLFFLPWLLFFLCGMPAVSPHVTGGLLAGVAALMLASPLLAALLVRRLQRRTGVVSRLPFVVGALAALVNCPVILLVLFVSLHRATP